MHCEARMEDIENSRVCVSLRIPFFLHKEIMRGSDPKKRVQTERYLRLVQDGFRVQEIREMASDPEKKLDFEKKLRLLIKDVQIEHTLQTMDTGELDGLIFMATQVKESKIKQLLLKYPQ